MQRAYTEGIGSSGFTRGALAATEPFDLVILPGPAVLVLSFFAFLLLVPPLFPSAALFYISQKNSHKQMLQTSGNNDLVLHHTRSWTNFINCKNHNIWYGQVSTLRMKYRPRSLPFWLPFNSEYPKLIQDLTSFQRLYIEEDLTSFTK